MCLRAAGAAYRFAESSFDQLFTHREEIEHAFGGSLRWQRLEGKRACRIRHTDADGGYRSPEVQWPALHDALCWAMDRLERAAAASEAAHAVTCPDSSDQ